MATVFIPALWRDATGGLDRVEIPGRSVRAIVDALDAAYPGLKARAVADDTLNPRVAVSVDGQVSRVGLLERVGETSEVHFLPAISGGEQ